MLETVSVSAALSNVIANLTTEVEAMTAALSEKRRALRVLTRAAGALTEPAPAAAGEVRETQYERLPMVEMIHD